MSASASSGAATAKAIRDGRARTARILRELDRERGRTPPPLLTCPDCGFRARPWPTQWRRERRGRGPLSLCFWCLPPGELEVWAPQYHGRFLRTTSLPRPTWRAEVEARERMRWFGEVP